ncbi:MAG: DUF2202 domain-containing protein [Ardenticatenaceae bacterium]|nr:DUF2202 domain-containing protein [Ardenticatenaceae bacterium]
MKHLTIITIAFLALGSFFFVQPAAAQTTLTDDEAAGLLFMREEEKVARDVYLTLYDEWGLRVFSNIASSEQQHMDAILTLVNLYGLTDPVGSNDVGVFTNPDLQALYDDLLAQGLESPTAAIEVGILIEQTDIADLQARLATTDNSNIERVYGNLLRGSQNHLAAFERTAVNATANPTPNPNPIRRHGRGNR